MLNEQRVLAYVKDNLGWPFMHLELEDQKIFRVTFNQSEINEIKKMSSYNKAILKTVLESIEQ